MPGELTPGFKQASLEAILSSADVRVALLKSTYSYNPLSPPEFMADVAAHENGRLAAGLTGKTFDDGVFDADDGVIPATAADESNALVVFIHTGSDATARIVSYVSRTPFTPAASQGVNTNWDPVNGVFEL